MAILIVVTHVLVWLIVLGCLVLECRWAARQSRIVGATVLSGLALRVLAGVACFVISDYDLGILRGLHTGRGFWEIAIDAISYYDAAAASLSHPFALTTNPGSPGYVMALALWLRLAGASVLSAILFNVVCHAIACAAILVGSPKGEANPLRVMIPLAAVTFSPLLLLAGTQVLKDPFFAMLTIVAFRAAFSLLMAAPGGVWRAVRQPAAAVLVVCLWLASGIRVYYAAFIVCGLAVAWLAAVVGKGLTRGQRGQRAATGLVVLTAAGMAVIFGGGEMYKALASEVLSRGLRNDVEYHRSAFARAGGNTNLSDAAESGAGSGSITFLPRAPHVKAVTAMEPPPATVTVKRVGVGLLAIFVPMSVLKAASVVAFTGGRGLLFITDVDTLFGAGVWIAVAWFLFRRMPDASVPSLVLVAAVSGVCAVLMAYEVTNFGTLFRLRLLASLPVWLAPLAVRPNPVAIGRSRP
jgi:hypothetical protein